MSRNTAGALGVVLLFLFSTMLQAQLVAPTLVGTIKDPSGAVVPGATVIVRNVHTGLERSVITGSGGDYTLTNLQIGHYSVTVSHTGFKTTTVPDVQLRVGQSARVDAVLQVGSASQHVTVAAIAPLLNTTSSSVGLVVPQQVLEDIPLNGRAFWQLTQLTPGATYTPGGQSPYTGTDAIRARAVNVSINGGNTQVTGWSLDGANITEVQAGGTDVQPDVDAIQEFKVNGADMGAEFGHSPTMVMASIKSGTNQFHGDLWEFVKNNAFDANNFFFQPPVGSNETSQPLKWNQFGGTLGGPIKHDKAFFFVDFEQTLFRQAEVFDNVVPSNAMRQGDFSAELPGTQLLNPQNNYAPFPNNQIPPSMFSPQAQFFMKYLPTPNLVQGTTSFAVFGNRNTLNTSKGDLKIDEALTAKDHLMGRYSINDNTEIHPNPFPTLGAPSDHSRGQDLTIAYTHIFNAHWLNTAQASYYRSFFLFGGYLQGQFFNQQANIQGLELQPYGGFPEIDMSGYSSFVGSPSNCLPKANHIRTWDYTDTVSYSNGKHTIQMGADYSHSTLAFINGAESEGAFEFYGTYTGDAFGDFLLGDPNNVTRDGGTPLQGTYGNFEAGFFQDNFRATSNLTLNMGLRYEINPFYTGEGGALSGFEINTGKLVIPSNFDPTAQPISAQLVPLYKDRYVLSSSVGLPDSIRPTAVNDWGPRLGFAWRPFGSNRWAVRAGYGIFYAYPDNNLANNTASVPPIFALDTEFNNSPPAPPNRTFGNFFLGVPLAGLPNPNPGQPCPFGFVAISCSTPSLSTGVLHAQQQYVQEYNFSVQRQLTRAVAIDVAYVGNVTRHLQQNESINDPIPGPGSIQPRRPYPQWSTIGEYQYGGTANYNALQISVNSRAWHGLSLLGSYTYSKCMDNGSDEGGAPTEALIPANYAVCALDRTQASALSYDYLLPVGRGQHFLSSQPGWVNGILGGWHLSGVLTLQSGLPFTPTISGDQANTGVGPQWPNRVGKPLVLDNTACWFFTSYNTSCTALDASATDAFVEPALYTYGNGGRNTMRAEGLKELDFALLKNFKLTESKTLQFRAESFNLGNWPIFATPSTDIDTGSGGVVTSTLNAAREIQFALKLYF
ncbi:MAG: carboxypeptidase-like regulatory domain-containing protein [Terriglobia bacterium]